MQFKPGHDAVTMEDVVTGQQPDRLTDRVVFLTYRALHIAVSVFLSDDNSGEGGNFLFLSRRRTRVLKLTQ